MHRVERRYWQLRRRRAIVWLLLLVLLTAGAVWAAITWTGAS